MRKEIAAVLVVIACVALGGAALAVGVDDTPQAGLELAVPSQALSAPVAVVAPIEILHSLVFELPGSVEVTCPVLGNSEIASLLASLDAPPRLEQVDKLPDLLATESPGFVRIISEVESHVGPVLRL